MRDILEIPFSARESLIIAADNSGAIGMKDHDAVRVPYEVVAYYSFRVAVMECMAAGGVPISAVLHNFCSDGAWDLFLKGVAKGAAELGLIDLPVTGSTETNFQLLQSAIGMIVVGRKEKNDHIKTGFDKGTEFAVIGKPLVGEEVLERNEEMAPLSLFKWMSEQPEVLTILPIGSKGIAHEVNQLRPGTSIESIQIEEQIELEKSAGPSTCFLILYSAEGHEKVKEHAGALFHKITILGTDT
ncbi:ATP-binding protein [Lederbergia citrea]|uniref:ATP-binding protein n=1 Tax=Lederbergia citrea TaxID=2833581 RepID=A0A942UP64_9BACI|nr:ATP-binding protein [Lederbergia citrea]MBS4204691.1 ATP-binding protein [Lederbergia citrea]MBS4223462.1 ATP-binding protein [Lederbergia citrea]